MKRPTIHTIPLAEVRFLPGTVTLTMSVGQWDALLAEAWMRQNWDPSPKWKPETIGARYLEMLAKKTERLALLDASQIIAISVRTPLELAVEAENRLGLPLIASELVEVCELHAVEIPGKPSDEDRSACQVGKLCKQLFRDGDALDVEGFSVNRTQKEYRKLSGDLDTTNAYTFAKACQTTQTTPSTQCPLTL